MGTSIVKIRVMKSRGFSLLEIIIVLAFIGAILVTAANYARKMIDEKTRQGAADAVVQEIYGVLQFVSADTIEIFGSNSSTDKSIKKVTNPLYQLPHKPVYPDAKKNSPDAGKQGFDNNPIWLAHPHNVINIEADATNSNVSPYIARNYSRNITGPVSNELKVIYGKSADGTDKEHYSHSLKWGEALWGKNSVRKYFTDSGCPGNTDGGNAVYFKQQFLSCNENPALKNSEIGISRIDFVNDRGAYTRLSDSDDLPVPVERVDVYVSFRAVGGESARIEQFITPLMTAFRTKKIIPDIDNIFLVVNKGSTRDNAWTLLDKRTGLPFAQNTPKNAENIARFSDLPDMVGNLQKGATYAIRFSFDGKGDYLRTDGLNAATKLCWNTSVGAAGPCLTSPSDELLVLKSRKSSTDLANLQVGSVISTINHEVKDNNGNIRTDIVERYTAPRIQYKVFSNTGSIAPVSVRSIKDSAPEYCLVDGSCDKTHIDSIVNSVTLSDVNNGAIAVELQTCPVADGFTRNPAPYPDKPDHPDNHRLYPRLSASVSSVISGLHKNGGLVDSVMPLGVFATQSKTLQSLNIADFSVNRMGGVALSNRLVGNRWLISGMVASENNNLLNGGANQSATFIYFNPSWLSVVVTTWCSDHEQQ